MLNLINRKEPIDTEIYKDAVKLDAFSVNIRYPDIIIIPTEKEIIEAITIAENIKKFVIARIKSKG
ncbi:MAG: hypothetical protein HW421_3780 [Ignavibacteria bacterium]|nr:hypothetical protein [Ignavibacteria bacterium]